MGIPPPMTRPALSLTPSQPDQVPRLARFREDHPGVRIADGAGYWQALVPKPDGEDIYTRYFLRDLLDKLDEVLEA